MLWTPAAGHGRQATALLTTVVVCCGLFLAGCAASEPSAGPGPISSGVPAGGLFGELPPGSTLPSDQECAARVQRNPWEPRPQNDKANHTVPPVPFPAATASLSSPAADRLKERVDGQFTGTTDEIIQWASCKWGYPTEIARAQAVEETHWDQSYRGDGGVSYGLFQVKSTVWTGTLPWSQKSTAYNADWAMAVWRACYEGLMYYGPQSRGDTWGCVGGWWSGDGPDHGGASYERRVQSVLSTEPYLSWPSSAGGQPPTPSRTG
ncbi:MAG: hypothetical protein ACRDRS_00485 [Pseudonocardiaceae bacterium]